MAAAQSMPVLLVLDHGLHLLHLRLELVFQLVDLVHHAVLQMQLVDMRIRAENVHLRLAFAIAHMDFVSA